MIEDAPLPRSAELVVIGGGVVGAATAFFAARAGLRPLLLERRPRLCTLTTAASTGAFRLQFDNQEELQLVRRSVQFFLSFAEETQQREYDLGIRQQGYLWLTTDEEGVSRQRRLVASQHAWGQTDVELLSDAEVRQRFPYVGENVLGARFRAGDGFLDPKQLTLGMASASGATIVTGCDVIDFKTAGGRISGLETSKGTVSTHTAVIACGPLSGVLAAHADLRLPIETVVRQKLIVPEVAEVPALAPMTIDDDTGAHWRPALQGAYLLFTDPLTPPSPPVESVQTDARFAFNLLRPDSPVSVSRVVPFWRDVWRRSAAHWFLQAGQYTMTPDRRPLIGETPIAGLYVNTGYSGHGVMGSPAGSRLLVEILVGKLAAHDNPFRLDREFTRRETDIL